jgi:DNA-binding transcriptional MerR regulator
MRIGELAVATGTNAETIRYYERVGLLPRPARTGANYRSYGRPELERLSFIRRAHDLGFTIEQVREPMALADDDQRPCNAVNRITTTHLESIERKIADLRALQSELQCVLTSCRRGKVAYCRIIELLSPSELPVHRARP